MQMSKTPQFTTSTDDLKESPTLEGKYEVDCRAMT